ncbi:MAG: ribonuclease Z [Clostridia bacterium]|nr:ribonuclease Z [Clostridia bacterium]
MGKGMTVAVCIDDKGGMTLFGKRQSRDRELIRELCESYGGVIYIRPFSTHIFAGWEDRISVSDDPIGSCPDGGLAFVEDIALMPYLDSIERLIVYKWNELYPSDRRLDLPLSLFEVKSRVDFKGSSHDRISKLTMTRKDG